MFFLKHGVCVAFVVTCVGLKREIVLLTEQLIAAIAAGDYRTYTWDSH